jgi:hypothetical protein
MDSCAVGNGPMSRSGRRPGRSYFCPEWAVGLSVAGLLTVPSALAQEIRVTGDDCATSVHLVAQDAHLADVLGRLAQALDFQLSFESDSNPIVTVNAVGQATDLVARLAPSGNISMTQARNSRCPQRERILNVWVLPNGQEKPAISGQAQQAQEEQARREQEGIALVLKSHGVPPPNGGKTKPQ